MHIITRFLFLYLIFAFSLGVSSWFELFGPLHGDFDVFILFLVLALIPIFIIEKLIKKDLDKETDSWLHYVSFRQAFIRIIFISILSIISVFISILFISEFSSSYGWFMFAFLDPTIYVVTLCIVSTIYVAIFLFERNKESTVVKNVSITIIAVSILLVATTVWIDSCGLRGCDYLYSRAVQEKNTAICESVFIRGIAGVHDYRGSLCRYHVASKVGDENLCGDSDYCYEEMAKETKNINLCRSPICYYEVERTKYRESITTKDLAYMTNNAQLCQSIQDYPIKDLCYSGLASKLKDPLLCDKVSSTNITDAVNKYRCFWLVEGGASSIYSRVENEDVACPSIQEKETRGRCENALRLYNEYLRSKRSPQTATDKAILCTMAKENGKFISPELTPECF